MSKQSKLYIALFLLFTMNSFLSDAQLINGNAFLKGKYVEVGMSQCGGWGTTTNAPDGYHARSGVQTGNGTDSLNGYLPQPSDNQLNLGFVADPDQDGWAVGSPNKYNGDYFLPRAPWVGWGISFGGHNYTTDRSGSSNTNCNSLSKYNPFPGAVQSVSADLHQAVWLGADSGLQLQKTVTVQDSKVYFVVKVQLTNTSSQTINNIYYGDYVNPDNDAYYMDQINNNSNLSTNNTIVFQNPGDNQALIQAIGPVTQAYLGLGSKDCRAKVFYRKDNQQPPTGSAMDWFTASNFAFSGSSGVNNLPIGIVFNIGSLEPNATTTFTYTYILKQSDFDDALGATDPGFLINDSVYSSGQNVYPCTSPLDITIVNNNNNYGNWTWSPADGLNTTQGEHVIATVADTPRTYTVTGSGDCGIKTLTITINPIPPPDLSPSISIVASANLLCSPQAVTFTATESDGLLPSYQWKVNGVNVGTNSLTYTYTPANNDTVICIMNNNHPCDKLPPDTSNAIIMKVNSSNVLYVDSSVVQSGNGASWNTPFKTLNEALDWVKICPNITTINVAKGTYFPTGIQSGTDRDTTFAIYRGGIKLYGGYPSGGGNRDIAGNPTILDGNIASSSSSDNSYHVMLVAGLNTNADSVVIDGFTIQNGNANGNGNFDYSNGSNINQNTASGLILYNVNNQKIAVRNTLFLNNHASTGAGLGISNSSAIVQKCTFSNNVSDNLGGAIYAYQNSSLNVINSSFTNNASESGAAIYQDGGALSLANNSFNQNTATNGGAVLAANISSLPIDSCSFSNNTATSDASGIVDCEQTSAVINNSKFISNNGTAVVQAGNSLSVRKSFFQNNTSQGSAGAIRTSGNTVAFTANIFYQNIALSDAGAVALSRSDGAGVDTIINNLFIQNKISSSSTYTNTSGAISDMGGQTSFITNNTFYNNTSTGEGGAIYFSGQNSNRIVANDIFYKSFTGTSDTDITVAPGGTIAYQGANLYSNGSNPLFVNENNLLTGGLSLQIGSLAVNKGNNKYVPSYITTDIADSPRIISDVVDIGAYESPYYSVDSIVVHTKNYVPAQVAIGAGVLQMVAEVYPLTRSQTVIWSIIPVTGTATISADGAITGQTIGAVWAKAVSILNPNMTDSMLVEVVKVDSVVVRTVNNVLPQIYDLSQTLQLTATVYPLNVSQQVVWSIRPLNGTATIDANGLVTAVSGGNVWAKATSVVDTTKSDSILINICSTKFAVGLYPNPVQNNLNINVSVPCGMDIYKAPSTYICNYVYPPVVQVFNGTTGSLVYSQTVTQNNFSLPVGRLTPGIYYIQLNAALFQARTRFIKK